MAYSQIQVIAGGLAHIPVITGVFWMFERQSTKFYGGQTKPKPIAKLKPIEQKADVLEVETISKTSEVPTQEISNQVELEEKEVKLIEKDQMILNEKPSKEDENEPQSNIKKDEGTDEADNNLLVDK